LNDWLKYSKWRYVTSALIFTMLAEKLRHFPSILHFLPRLIGKRSLKYRAAKYYNDLPEEIKFKLDESARYNKFVLKNYLVSIEY